MERVRQGQGELSGRGAGTHPDHQVSLSLTVLPSSSNSACLCVCSSPSSSAVCQPATHMQDLGRKWRRLVAGAGAACCRRMAGRRPCHHQHLVPQLSQGARLAAGIHAIACGRTRGAWDWRRTGTQGAAVGRPAAASWNQARQRKGHIPEKVPALNSMLSSTSRMLAPRARSLRARRGSSGERQRRERRRGRR